MLEYKVGDYIEVGVEDISCTEDNNWNYYFQIDVPNVTEESLFSLFEEKSVGYITHINVNTPTSIKKFEGTTYSQLFKKITEPTIRLLIPQEKEELDDLFSFPI